MFLRGGASQAVADNSEHLARDRNRFQTYDDAPPPYQQHENRAELGLEPSATHGTEEDQRKYCIDWYFKILNGMDKTNPQGQFVIQKFEEAERIAEQRGSTAQDCAGEASLIVEARWRAQGIWSSRWRGHEPGYRWAHEYPLKREPSSDSENEHENEALKGNRTGFSIFQPKIQPAARPRRFRSKHELRESEERRQARYAKRAHNHALSRPLQQFTVQIEDECNRLIEAHEKRNADQEPAPPTPLPLDINTTAYETVKARWKKSGIWRACWSIMPGREWKHEIGLRTLLFEEMGADNVAKLPPDYVRPDPVRVFSPTPEPEAAPVSPAPFNDKNVYSIFNPKPSTVTPAVEERGEGSGSGSGSREVAIGFHETENGNGAIGKDGGDERVDREAARDSLGVESSGTNGKQQTSSNAAEIESNAELDERPPNVKEGGDTQAESVQVDEHMQDAGQPNEQQEQDLEQEHEQVQDQPDDAAAAASASPRRSSRVPSKKTATASSPQRPRRAAACAGPSAAAAKPQGISKKKSAPAATNSRKTRRRG